MAELPQERGTLTIDDRVVRRVATIAAGRSEGVTRVASPLRGVWGHGYPRVDAHIAGGSVRLAVDIAVDWHADLPTVTDAVRRDVAQSLTTLTGMRVTGVDVTAARVRPAASGDPASIEPASADSAAMPAERVAAPAPRSSARLGLAGCAMASACVALGVVGVREGLVAAGVVSGPSWVSRGVDLLDGLAAQCWAIPAGVALVLVGLWLLVTALAPRRVAGRALVAVPGAYLRTRDVSRLASLAVADVDGVVAARVTSRRRGRRLRVRVTGDTASIDTEAAARIGERLAILQAPPRVRVTRTAGVPR